MYNAEAMKMAMRDLKGESFKLWCYLAHQSQGTIFNLGQTPCENATGIKKDTYYKSKDSLIDKGYIVQEDDGKWYFYEVPEKQIQQQVFTINDF